MRHGFGVVAALMALQAAPAYAERDPHSGAPTRPDEKYEIPSPITDHFYIRGTFFSSHVRTDLRVDPRANGPGAPVPGTLVSGERDLGLDAHRNEGRIEFMFRLRERSRLRVDYFQSERRGDQAIPRDIQFGDETFTTGDVVASEVDWRSFGLSYTYSFIRNDRIELGTGLALSAIDAQARGSTVHNGTLLRQDKSGAGAFPTIPVDFTWRVTRRLAFTARGQYFHASIGGFDGSLAEYHADVQWRAWRNLAFGAGYTMIRAILDVSASNFPGLFRLSVKGPEAFFRVSF